MQTPLNPVSSLHLLILQLLDPLILLCRRLVSLILLLRWRSVTSLPATFGVKEGMAAKIVQHPGDTPLQVSALLLFPAFPGCLNPPAKVPAQAAPPIDPLPISKKIIIIGFYCQEARCVLRTSCSERLPQPSPLMDSPDPSKTQSAVGTVLRTISLV